jgi:hypothetical protein
MAYGYGFPLFNFYAPLSYYAAELVSLLAQNLQLGLRLTFALGIYLSGLTMYRWARDSFSAPAALAGAAAYMYAPYHGYDIFFRGNLAESFAWWFLPLILWCTSRLVRTQSWGWFTAATLAYAGLLLTHNAFALLFSPLLIAYPLWFLLFAPSAPRPITRPLVQIALVAVFGLALTTFFWFPALTERGLVHSDRLLVPPTFVYWGNFATVAELFSPPLPVYPDLLNPTIPRALGLAILLFTLPGLLWLRPGRNLTIRTEWLFFGLVTVVYVLLTLPLSRPVWDSLPLLEYVQFPWRLLGCTAVSLAWLVAAGVDALTPAYHPTNSPSTPLPTPYSLFPTLFAILLIPTTSLFWFTPRLCPGLDNPTVADLVQFEQLTATIGTTAKGEYVPKTVAQFPAEPATTPFASLPEGGQWLAMDREPLKLTGEFETAVPTTLQANLFAYPGWVAWLDGERVAIQPSQPHGLVSVAAPPGRHTIEISWQEPNSRRVANATSGFALLMLGLIGLLSWRSPAKFQPTASPAALPIWFLGVALLLPFGLRLVLPRLETPLYRPGLTTLQHQTHAQFGEGLVLQDYQIAAREMAADEEMPVTLWFSLNAPLSNRYQTLVQLVDEAGQIWTDSGGQRPRNFRPYPATNLWQMGEYAEDPHLVGGFPGLTPGLYHLRLTVFNQETLAPVPTQNGQLYVDLGTVQVTRPERPAAVEPQYTANAQFGELTLIGYGLDRREAAVGDPFTLTLFWQAAAKPTQDWQAELWLVTSFGTVPFAQTFPAGRADWPTTQWEVGDVWRSQYSFRIPASTPSGDYRWFLCLKSEQTACPVPQILGDFLLSAPQRTFEKPAVTVEINRSLGEFALLNGVSVPKEGLTAGQNLPVTLVWQAKAETVVSYRVFLQLLGPDGQVIAQSDGEPANWTRPTTSWYPGEFVLDERLLTLPGELPSGRYQLITGLYELGGARVQGAAGEDFLLVQEWEVK